VKVGIVVPYSWSFWGGVVEHAQEQSDALAELGVETRILIGHDPPGLVSGLNHPSAGRFERPPPHVIPLGRSVITPANRSLANIVLSPSAVFRLKRALERERFDLLHVHEPLTPALGVAALAYATTPLVATFHAAGPSRWRRIAPRFWGFLLDRIDLRIAVSEAAAATARGYLPGEYRLIPNGVRLPGNVDLGGRDGHVVFVGRHEQRKGLAVLLRAWPAVHRRTGARLRLVGTDPLAARHLLRRERVPAEGIDLLGVVPTAELDRELARAKLLVAPSLGSESFGMVITRAFAAATPVVASDIDGYRQVVDRRAGVLVRPGDERELAGAITSLLTDEPSRRACAAAARAIAERGYAWPSIAETLRSLYEELLEEVSPARPVAGLASAPAVS
jgi:phosphatidylinositol alpha-mannosyltransferase